jgi:hypothetical protein
MKTVLILFIITILCGCAVIVDKGDDDVKVFGMRKDEGLDTLQRIKEKQDDEKYQVPWFKKAE